MNRIYILLAFLYSVTGYAQTPSHDWHFSPYHKSKLAGIGLEEGMKAVADKSASNIIVAVIDAGVDVYHPDLKDQLWINKDEIANNGVDDDNNGYIDDIYGWNFIGGKDSSVGYDNMEVTRQYLILKKKYDGITEEMAENKVEYRKYAEMRDKISRERMEAKSYYEFFSQIRSGMSSIESTYSRPIDLATIKAHQSANRAEEMAKLILVSAASKSKDDFDFAAMKSELDGAYDHYNYNYNYGYNLDFDPRDIVGDNYDNAYERTYGNNEVYYGEDFSSHGTHVAGIIAANSSNNIGAKGICPTAKIMSIRVVPQGDERDKDVANGIIYAVDNGARIINMSFGKAYPHNTEVVKKAIEYAKSKNVLLVHAAGNDALNTDVNTFYPNDFGDEFKSNWIEVGASSWEKKPRKIASFSNYGKLQVDLFAPGVAIYSTTPENQYEAFDGTSMASPVVAGVAALVWSYYPDMTAEQIRSVLVDSALPIKGKQRIPGDKKKSRVNELSVTGSIINVAAALKLAEERSK